MVVTWHRTKNKYFPKPCIQETDENKYTCTKNGYSNLQNDKKTSHKTCHKTELRN